MAEQFAAKKSELRISFLGGFELIISSMLPLAGRLIPFVSGLSISNSCLCLSSILQRGRSFGDLPLCSIVVLEASVAVICSRYAIFYAHLYIIETLCWTANF